MRSSLLLLLVAWCTTFTAQGGEMEDARKRWAASPHGPMLERTLPPVFEPADLPEPRSRGAQLTARYCIQCHVLPDPARYSAREWLAMVARMGKNMDWMTRVVGSRPISGEPQLRIEDINAFLARHARKPR